MGSDKLRVVIIDNNRKRRELVMSMLPDYTEPVPCDFGEKAYSQLTPGAGVKNPDAVIIAGDDPRNRDLETFEWIKDEKKPLGSIFVPVLILVEDEFSDKSTQFYEIGEACFYEGEPQEIEFYSAFIETIDSVPEETEHYRAVSYTEKSSQKIMGKTVKAPDTPDDTPRRVILTNAEVLSNLAAAVEANKEKAIEQRELQAELGHEYGAHNVPLGDDEDIPEEFRIKDSEKQKEEEEKEKAKAALQQKLENARKRALERLENDSRKKDVTAPDDKDNRPIIVVVDDHDFVRKMFEMTLSDKYKVVSLPSGMTAVDYFVHNNADLLFMDAVMPGMSGVSAMNSIRWQRNGEKVPCIYLMGNDYKGGAASLSGNYVFGTLPKPVSKGAILTAIEQMKRFVEALR